MIQFPKYKKAIKEWLLIVGLAIVWAIPNVNDWQNKSVILNTIFVSICIWILMWKGNQFIARKLDSKFSWIDFPLKRFFSGFLFHSSYSIAAIWLFGLFLDYFFDIYIGYKETAIYSVLVTLFIVMLMQSIDFFRAYRKSFIREQKLETELLNAKYQALKNQVNPHFLFNSLNTLSDLIHSDQDMASKFVDEMSSVFRYVLDSNKKDLVSDVKELKFLNSYLYLQKKRFGEGLICEVYSEPSDKLIPPLSLYMLVENAIKHNSISTSNPLTIRILKREDCLIVENNIQKKDIPQNESTKMGLKNLEERYRHFNTTQFKIEENTGKFIVTLPLL